MVLKRLIHHQKFIIIYSLIVLSFGLLGIGLEIERARVSDHFGTSLLVTFLYFTTQSNLLLTITLLLFLLKKHVKNTVNYLAFITLVNISITGIIFHTLLVPYMENINFMHHVLHTINPILYIIFYFLFFDYKIPLNRFWISLVYPFVFMIFVYIFIEPFLGNLIETTAPNYESARYVYPFLDPQNYPRETLGLIGFNLGLLAPLIILFSFGLLYLKHKIHHKIHIS